MLILITILIIAATAVFLATRKRKLTGSESTNNLEAANYRPLFQPTDEELRAFENDETRRANDASAAVEKQEFEARLAASEAVWRDEPTAGNTAEFLRLATTGESSDIFIAATKKIIQFWQENRTVITARDLADLLDSHFRLLPQQERTSGEIFDLRTQIDELRREVRGN
ncbi:MAG: hypothetical protein IPN69_23195 [Acidobacteria bacterium]|nr:hypothetical protein [Acidobacteriota bacterium]